MSEKKKVLVVSRTPSGQLYLSIALNRLWFNPLVVTSIRQAVDTARQEQPAVILLDGDMQKEEQRSLIAVLTEEEGCRNVPLVVATMDDTPNTREDLLSRRCAAVLSKPIDLLEAYEVLGRLAGERRKYPRVGVRIPVKVEGDDDVGMVLLSCTNLSEGGMHLLIPELLSGRTVFRLSFTLPADSQEIRTLVEVVRTEIHGAQFENEPSVGVRFIEIAERDRLRITRFVQHSLIGDLDWNPDLLSVIKVAEDA